MKKVREINRKTGVFCGHVLKIHYRYYQPVMGCRKACRSVEGNYETMFGSKN